MMNHVPIPSNSTPVPSDMVSQIGEQIAAEFGFPFTPSQQKAAYGLSRFVATALSDCAYILRGYAGTGKTSLVGALVRVLKRRGHEVVLLAPTGRAAKVLAAHSGMPAYTIHKMIYRQQTFNGEGTHFSLGFNKLKRAFFIVDEASMLDNNGGPDSLFGTGQVMDDLIRFVFEGSGCRLLFVGDVAQLPPVGQEESPALSRDVLEGYGLRVGGCTLTEVVRQRSASDVLTGATMLRRMLADGDESLPVVSGSPCGEVRFLPGDELIEALDEAYSDFGTQGTIVITRSNKRANLYNQGIRTRIFGRDEDLLAGGDLVMAVKNNYYWTELAARELPKDERLPFDFIANGDTAEVVSIRNEHEQYGFLFADATLRFPDYDDYELTCRVLLSTLQSESPSLTPEERNRLYESVLEDYADVPSRKEKMKKLREDPYYNALQLKYAYAVTCHKAQGGQWPRVFVDQGYLAPEMLGAPYLRWLYTAFTRTTGRLYLVNWPKEQRADVE